LRIADVQAKGIDEQQDVDTSDLYDKTIDIPKSVFDEKRQAFETIAIYCSTLQARFAPYFVQCLELTLPSLRFAYHKGVREACLK
jgi:importin-5